MPGEFIGQDPKAANPPTFFLILADMAEQQSIAAKEDLDFLKTAWPRLHQWFQWYNTTQQGPLPGSYRWRGRDSETTKELNPKTLASGMDDYPRASHPTDNERHLDLRCWMAVASKAMYKISKAVKAPEKLQKQYEYTANILENYDNLKALHWDSENSMFADWGLDTSDVELVQYVDEFDGQVKWYRSLNGAEPENKFVNHVGYVTLFPFALKLIPRGAAELDRYLDIIRDSDGLWSEYGIRSLSKKSSIYMQRNTPHDPPYWRGTVWVNMNYLVLSALRYYGQGNGPLAAKAARLGDELRCNLLKNIVSQYREKGYLFENYDGETGEGGGCHPFTGWTALLPLMAQQGQHQACDM